MEFDIGSPEGHLGYRELDVDRVTDELCLEDSLGW
jgi:hypothetical protein